MPSYHWMPRMVFAMVMTGCFTQGQRGPSRATVIRSVDEEHRAVTGECSEPCVDEGRCRSGPKGECVVGSSFDCLYSLGCRNDGRCHRDIGDNMCVAKTAEDCEQSRGCAEDGECHLDHQEGRCDEGYERLSPSVAISGFVHLGVGGVHAWAGTALALAALGAGSLEDRTSNGSRSIDGTVIVVGMYQGIASMALGAVLAIAGMVKVPRIPKGRGRGLAPWENPAVFGGTF